VERFREQIRKFGDQVQCIAVAELLERARHRDPDILVDAEGFDQVIGFEALRGRAE
jgi:hypothetical protein